MPRWEVHLSVSSMALLVIFTGALLGFFGSGPDTDLILSSMPLIKGFILGALAFLLGSVLPDLDGKGRIRWTLSPLLGSLAIMPNLILHISSGNWIEVLSYLYYDGARLFFIVTVLSSALLLLPLRHRGIMHSSGSAVIFGMVWGAYSMIFAVLSPQVGVLVGCMAAAGYLWHLAMDGELRVV